MSDTPPTLTTSGPPPDRPLDRQGRFEAAVLPHVRGLFATAYRMTRRPADAEDLVQETMLKAYQAFERLPPGSSLRAWLHTILHNARTDAWRRKSRRPEHETPETFEAADPQRHDAAALARLDLERALHNLPEAYRSAIVLRDVQGFDYREIAEILGVALGTVMSRIHRGRALLRAGLRKEP